MVISVWRPPWGPPFQATFLGPSTCSGAVLRRWPHGILDIPSLFIFTRYKIFGKSGPSTGSAHRGRNLGPMNPAACQLFANLGRSFSVPESLGAGAVLRRCIIYMTPCQPLTARTDDPYPFVYYLNFWTPSGTYLPRVKNNNNASGRTQWHHALNDVASAGIPGSKEPTGIYRDSMVVEYLNKNIWIQ